jgi:hypothetical protein
MSGGSIWASLECQCCFWIAGGLESYTILCDYPPSSYSIQKQYWHSREAQIELPLIECEWAFRIQASDINVSVYFSKGVRPRWRHIPGSPIRWLWRQSWCWPKQVVNA